MGQQAGRNETPKACKSATYIAVLAHLLDRSTNFEAPCQPWKKQGGGDGGKQRSPLEGRGVADSTAEDSWAKQRGNHLV